MEGGCSFKSRLGPLMGPVLKLVKILTRLQGGLLVTVACPDKNLPAHSLVLTWLSAHSLVLTWLSAHSLVLTWLSAHSLVLTWLYLP